MPWGQNFDPNRKALSLWPFVANLKKKFLSTLLYIFLNYFIHVYSPGQGQTNPWGQNFDVNRKALSFWPFVASFKKITLKSDFIHIFSMFSCMYIAPGQEQTSPWWQSFDVSRKPRSLWPFVASFIMIPLNSDFIHIFNDLKHVYSPGARADKPLGSKFWCQQKSFTTSTICCKLKKNLFEF